MGALNWNPEITQHNQRLFMREQSLSTSKSGLFKAPTFAGTDVRDGTTSTRPLTELGNAERLLDIHEGNVYFVHEAKSWLYWKDGAWHWDIDGAAVRSMAAELPERIYNEGQLNIRQAEYFAKWARMSQKERTILATVSLFQDFEQVRIPLSQIDANSYMVGLDHARQVLDLQTGITRPAAQNDFVTKSLHISHLGDSKKAVRWKAFLLQIFEDNTELIDWIQRWCGYLLTGSTVEQVFVFCFGLGANGKSVFAEIIRFILGDYVRAIAAETLTESKRQAGSASPDLAELVGARLATSSETEDGAALAMSLIKSLVAGDTMTVRKLYCAPVQFTPQFKLMMLGNHKPIIRGIDYGMWRRVRLIPFRRTFTPEERDPNLLHTLKMEAPHILAWMVEGCIKWEQHRLTDIPTIILQATGDYQEEQDIVGRWIDESCLNSEKDEATSTELYNHYKNWCAMNGLRPMSNIALGRRLGDRGLVKRKTNGSSVWLGLGPTDLSVTAAGLI